MSAERPEFSEEPQISADRASQPDGVSIGTRKTVRDESVEQDERLRKFLHVRPEDLAFAPFVDRVRVFDEDAAQQIELQNFAMRFVVDNEALEARNRGQRFRRDRTEQVYRSMRQFLRCVSNKTTFLLVRGRNVPENGVMMHEVVCAQCARARVQCVQCL